MNNDSLASAAALLEEGISRRLADDPSAVVCLSYAQAVFDREGDHWSAGIARQWHDGGMKTAQS
ncbi:MAG TPA: hypothetical protein VF495_10050 [Phenylobacterium sp.]